ncbi:2-hydroxy-3-oxopropionate reductase, partial [Burkholderia pseudomallei]
MATIGFIGLGIMGAHMARNLLKGGHRLVVNGAYPVPADLREQTQVVANSTAVAQAADIVIAMVPDTPDVRNVLFAEDGVAKGLSAGKLVIDMSSISPLDTREFAKEINALGCDYLDAPVSGGEVGARDAT